MKQPSAADSPQFRSLDGQELLEVLATHIDKCVREVLGRADNHFHSAKSYPVCTLNCVARIGLYHDPRTDIPYKSTDVTVKFASFVRPDESISGLNLILAEDVRFTIDVGRSVESAPDAIREQLEMLVLQPQKVDGEITDLPTGEVALSDLKCSKCGREFKSKPARNTHQNVHCGRHAKGEVDESGRIEAAA